MTRVRLQREIEVAAPPELVWDYVTDWPRQSEWVPLTRVEVVDRAEGLGGRIRAWTGLGPIGFWDPMTITGWERLPGGGGRCEVLHRGRLVRGEGEFSVEYRGDRTSRFTWAELLVLPAGPVGALGWRVFHPVAERMVDYALRRMRRRLEGAR